MPHQNARPQTDLPLWRELEAEADSLQLSVSRYNHPEFRAVLDADRHKLRREATHALRREAPDYQDIENECRMAAWRQRQREAGR